MENCYEATEIPSNARRAIEVPCLPRRSRTAKAGNVLKHVEPSTLKLRRVMRKPKECNAEFDGKFVAEINLP
ncbi:MAG: hypothetical protein A2161_02670 [Candidatus Schekmanbacteria bacterium RBG_13_48_7]|uniref:Uncharacterized protein n=1 Tax=Candidatus Schekmanbacteria bacterium RBG_13_48_7 TaxID=1817878 RepID=A0A1F7S332_9BACT|nr:MAG: hypothetical protein A2161_02670 [Candidatus Schekmanbacteria bacterium RBG_13_48_7]